MKMYLIELVEFKMGEGIAYKATDRTGKELISGIAATTEIALASIREIIDRDRSQVPA